MIAVVACRCPNALTKIYKFFRPLVENWMDIPVYQGRTTAQEFIAKFSGYPMGPKSPHELMKFIDKAGRYIAIIGYTEDDFTWADISHNSPQDVADAELIVEQFA